MYTNHCLAVKWIHEFSRKPYNNPLIKYNPHITDKKNEACRRLSPNSDEAYTGIQVVCL